MEQSLGLIGIAEQSGWISPDYGTPSHSSRQFNPLILNPSNAEATFVQKDKGAKIFEKHLNPVMLVL